MRHRRSDYCSSAIGGVVGRNRMLLSIASKRALLSARRLEDWAMVERYAHVVPEALQGAANRLDAFGSYVLATP
jgi:hypothetical protein